MRGRLGLRGDVGLPAVDAEHRCLPSTLRPQRVPDRPSLSRRSLLRAALSRRPRLRRASVYQRHLSRSGGRSVLPQRPDVLRPCGDRVSERPLLRVEQSAVTRPWTLVLAWLSGCAASHLAPSDGGNDSGPLRQCRDYRDCARAETCGGTDGAGFHCAVMCDSDSVCPAGRYCYNATCTVPCTPDDLSTCLPGAVCVSGVCRDPVAWANACTGHDDCPPGTGCHLLVSGLPACETIAHAYCDGTCRPGDPMFVCFNRECRPPR